MVTLHVIIYEGIMCIVCEYLDTDFTFTSCEVGNKVTLLLGRDLTEMRIVVSAVSPGCIPGHRFFHKLIAVSTVTAYVTIRTRGKRWDCMERAREREREREFNVIS